MLTHCFYVSKSTFAPHNVVDQDILHQARKNNTKLELTGCLFRASSTYAQILEGPTQSVEQIMEAIRVDARHYDIIEWSSTVATSRIFPEWSMGYAKNEIADAQLLAFAQAEQRKISEIAGVLQRVFEADYETTSN